ncbi:hypothetical protein [uncultured Gammaproteobacteria bacterium]|nr:hypothetical protein [uncultured Gammaproteobacteria bacterium]
MAGKEDLIKEAIKSSNALGIYQSWHERCETS